MAFNSGFKGLN